MRFVAPDFRLSYLPGIPSFGLTVPGPAETDQRVAAVEGMLSLLSEGLIPQDVRDVRMHCDKLIRMFAGVSAQSDRHWFRTSEMLGHPSPGLAGWFQTQLNGVKRSLRSRDRDQFERARASFMFHHGVEMLESFLDTARDGVPPVVEHDWTYILWSPSLGDHFHVGAGDGSIDDVVGHFNRKQGSGEGGSESLPRGWCTIRRMRLPTSRGDMSLAVRPASRFPACMVGMSGKQSFGSKRS